MLRKIAVLLMVVALAMPLAACQEEGPAEKAGKKLDEAVDTATDKAKELFE
jgi:outer membrane lipoprotein-sorting protein